ncbi:MAG: biopolymer transporter ExbD [Deltaproteobacteria bacterium]|nr:biopolymer transporter ExbD [Deltaproteobacteria bacterium]
MSARKAAKKMSDTTELDMIPIMGLFTSLILYLLKNFSVDPVQIQPTRDTLLPISNTRIAPKEAAVQVAITGRMILVEDRVVARVKNGRVEAEYKKDKNPASLLIVPLKEALVNAREKQKLIAKYNKKKKELQFKGTMTVIADKRIPFRLLTEVLYSAGQAEYGAYKFAVLKKESA